MLVERVEHLPRSAVAIENIQIVEYDKVFGCPLERHMNFFCYITYGKLTLLVK